MAISVAIGLTPMLLVLGGIFLPAGLQQKNSAEVIIGGAMLVVSLIIIMGGIIRRRQMNSQTAQLPDASRPHFFMPGNNEMAQAALMKCNYLAGEEIIQDYPNFPGKKN